MTNGDELGPTRPRRPDPREFDPERDPFPEDDSIPEILEWKLDVIMVLLSRLGGVLVLIFNIFVPGLGAIIFLLLAILGALTAIQALLSFLVFLVLFIVIRVVVPFLIQRARSTP